MEGEGEAVGGVAAGAEAVSTESLAKMLDYSHMGTMMLLQKQALTEIHATTDSLQSFNQMSEQTFRGVKKSFERHARKVKTIKDDFNNIFLRLRKLKILLNKHGANLPLYNEEEMDEPSEDEGDEEAPAMALTVSTDKLSENDGDDEAPVKALAALTVSEPSEGTDEANS